MHSNRFKKGTALFLVSALSVVAVFSGCNKGNTLSGSSENIGTEMSEISSGIIDLTPKDSGVEDLGNIDAEKDTSEDLSSPETGSETVDEQVSRWPAPTELDEETKLKTHNLIKDIISTYGANPESEKIEEYLCSLEEADPGQGMLWREIVNYWTYANEEMVVNIDELPDNLPEDDSLCIMVLGFELYDNGRMQPELIGRLNVALEAAKKYPNAYILCTGGGSSISNPYGTEADLMGDWLLENGLEKERLIIENKSMTTAENALNSYEIILSDYPQIKSIAVLSSSYHIAWGSLLLESSFMKAAYENQTPEIKVITNCAYPCVNAKYSDTLRFETGGMMQLIGEEYLAMLYYSGQR